MTSVYLVPHTHWDREWYFTAEQSRALLGETLAVVLDELESGRLPCFVLDGQTVLIEDYLSLVPADRARIEALVGTGRLLIGPWYTQSDQCVVGGESLARNLLYGLRDSRAFGTHMQTGYVPDSFGQSAQLPQILRNFGLERCVFWRGLWDGISPKSEFIWSAPDGSQVTTAVIQSGYAGVKGMPDDADVAERRMAQIRSHVTFMRPFNTTDKVLVMAGNDQQPWDPRLPEILDAENRAQGDIAYRLSNLDAFFDALAANGKLDTVSGEMLAGKYSRIHRGIWSTRYDIKKANADAEKLITCSLEPVLTIGWSLGMRYPHGLIERAWKKLLKSHAHDSIGCCNTDEVNRAVKQRLLAATQSCAQLLELRMRQIAERVRPRRDGERLVLFNTLPERRRELVTAEIVCETSQGAALTLLDGDGNRHAFRSLGVEAVVLSSLVQDLAAALQPGQSGDPVLYRHRLLIDAGELPALGYKTLYLQYKENGTTVDASVDASRATAAPEAGMIENRHLRVRLADDGTLDLTRLDTGQRMPGLLEFVDGGDDGDNYDFSPPRADWLISTRGQRPDVSVVDGTLRSSMRLRYRLPLPRDLDERAARRSSLTLPIDVDLALHAGEDFLRVEVDVDNVAMDHRLQAVFRTGLDTDVSCADQPFGMIRRPSKPVELDEWESAAWTSKPLPLYPMQGLVALSDGTTGLAVMTDGLREYEIDTNDTGTLAVTLFRSVGVMGKPDLAYRPGRLSGMPLPAPDSELPGPLHFRFALLPFDGDPAALAAVQKRYLARIECFHAGPRQRFSINRREPDLADSYSVATLEGPLVVSAVKKAEDKDAFLIRAFNPSFERAASATFAVADAAGFARDFRSATMNETPGALHGEAGPDGRIGAVPAQGIVTLMVDRDG